MLWVAVVLDPKRRSFAGEGKWSCFVAQDRAEAILRALRNARSWERIGRHYRVLVGPLAEEAVETQHKHFSIIEYKDLPLLPPKEEHEDGDQHV